MDDVWQNVFGKLFGRLTPKYDTDKRSTEKKKTLKGIWDELNVTRRHADKRVGLLQLNLFGSIHQFINVEKIYEFFPALFSTSMKSQSKPFELTKYHVLAENNLRFATELGLPIRYNFSSSILVSIRGQTRGDGRNGLTSKLGAEIHWRMAGELCVEIPLNGNYIATGFDVRLTARSPKEFNINYRSGELRFIWTPDGKVTDFIYHHVQSYTVTRNLADDMTIDRPAVPIKLSVSDKPMELHLANYLGVNVKLIKEGSDFNDTLSWYKWFTQFDLNSLFEPLQNRKYIIRYEPSGTRARSISTFFQYQHATKTRQNAIVYESGSSQRRISSASEIVSHNPIAAEFRPVLARVFKNIESGNAHLMRAGLSSEMKDGTFVHFNATMGLSKDDDWYTKDFADIQIEKYSSTGPSTQQNAITNRKIDYYVCYNSVRNWSNPPIYGFSEDVLYLTEEDTIAFGEQCDQNKIRLKVNAYRDNYAAKATMYSPAGKQCQKDMATGFMYGSPACTEARQLDQTYNNYELSAEAENLPEPLSYWVNSFRHWFNHKLYPFTVKHTQGESNPPNRSSWIVKRDPFTGESNITCVNPYETLVANNVGRNNEWFSFPLLAYAYTHVFHPLSAGSNSVRKTVKITPGPVSKSRCYVGPEAVYTFDGALYNYTVGDCPHVLLTDCHKQIEIAVIAHQGHDGHKIVTVIYGKDAVTLDSSGFININGVKNFYAVSMSKEIRIEIRERDMKNIKAVIYPLVGGGAMMEIRNLNFLIKVHGLQVELSAPTELRGKVCGLCGDFNQEVYDEWKTPGRCALPSGDLMAASYMV